MRSSIYLALLLMAGLAFTACETEEYHARGAVPQEVKDQLRDLGFNPDGIVEVENGYIIERDILITPEYLESEVTRRRVPGMEQYATDNLVTTSGSRTIRLYLNTSGFRSFPSSYGTALNRAIAAYNGEDLELDFQRVNTASTADIRFRRLSFLEEFFGILGSAGFPTAAGDPFDEISLSGRLGRSFSIDGIATVMAHEMGHCIGFRHTDYFDRSISCGGTPTDEGDAGVGANYIPGTPQGADLDGNGSWMLSCTDGTPRPFTTGDKTALDFLY